MNYINPLTTNVRHHIETRKLISSANKLTGFYMIGNIGRLSINWEFCKAINLKFLNNRYDQTVKRLHIPLLDILQGSY